MDYSGWPTLGTTRLEINEKMKIEIILAAIETAI